VNPSRRVITLQSNVQKNQRARNTLTRHSFVPCPIRLYGVRAEPLLFSFAVCVKHGKYVFSIGFRSHRKHSRRVNDSNKKIPFGGTPRQRLGGLQLAVSQTYLLTNLNDSNGVYGSKIPNEMPPCSCMPSNLIMLLALP